MFARGSSAAVAWVGTASRVPPATAYPFTRRALLYGAGTPCSRFSTAVPAPAQVGLPPAFVLWSGGVSAPGRTGAVPHVALPEQLLPVLVDEPSLDGTVWRWISGEKMEATSIIKKRRKKMRKHKWKKQRKAQRFEKMKLGKI